MIQPVPYREEQRDVEAFRQSIHDYLNGFILSDNVPSLATDPGTKGDIRFDDSYIYVCIAENTWKRSAISTW